MTLSAATVSGMMDGSPAVDCTGSVVVMTSMSQPAGCVMRPRSPCCCCCGGATEKLHPLS